MLDFFKEWKFTDTKTFAVLLMAFGLLFIKELVSKNS